MINIVLYKKNDKLIGFCINGHANYAEYGNDIVCSAVSMLAINTVNSIDSFTNDKFDLNIDEDTGYLSLIIKSNISKDSEVLLKALQLGVTNVMKQYGNDYIQVQFEEV
jgi:uncharacterized protein YsxB (DUF464 family)